MTADAGWSVRVMRGEGDGAVVFAGGERLPIAAPLSFDVEHRGLTAIECVLGAVGADLVSRFAARARARDVVVDHVEAVVRGALDNPLVALGVVGEAGSPALRTLAVRVYVSSPSAVDDARAAWDEALRRSPLAQTFRALAAFDAEFTVAP